MMILLTCVAVSILALTWMKVELVFTDSETIIPCCLTSKVLSERLTDYTKIDVCYGRDGLFNRLDASANSVE